MGPTSARTPSAPSAQRSPARVPEERLREAGRTGARARRLGRPGPRRSVDRVRRLAAARRGRSRPSATCRSSDAPRVVELRPTANIAAGEAAALARSRRRARGRPRFRQPTCSSSATRTGMPGCEAAADVPGAVVVETGMPVWHPVRGARAHRDLRRQPRVLRRCRGAARVTYPARARAGRAARGARAAARAAARRTRSGSASLFARPDVHYVLIASRGSSSNAARYAQYLLGRAHRIPVAFATPSLYTLYEQPPRLDGALVVGISQSGASPGRQRGDRRGAPTGTGRPWRSPTRSSRRLRPRQRGGAAARSGQRARRGGDEDLCELARCDRAAVHRGDRRRGRNELERVPAQLAAQIDRLGEDVDALGALEGGTFSPAASTTARASRSH